MSRPLGSKNKPTLAMSVSNEMAPAEKSVEQQHMALELAQRRVKLAKKGREIPDYLRA
jgi:hypothetical protein